MLPRRNDPPLVASARGMTLVEVLIGGALFSIVMASVYVLYVGMHETLNKGELKADLQQNARVGLAKMTQELRMAGYDPSGASLAVTPPPKAAVRTAAPGCFSFLADVEGFGKTSQITYILDGTTLRRRVDSWDAGTSQFVTSGGFQPLAGSVEVLAFSYYDANNQVLPMEDWTSTHVCPPNPTATLEKRKQLTYEQMRQIRRVGITLKTQGSRSGVSSESFTLTSDVHLRNL
jgi:type II secretory pathway component PulJ